MLRKMTMSFQISVLQELREPYIYILVAIFLCHLFFRFYNLETWTSFSWDQVDNAWASAKILIANKYPLIGMEAKQNSGMYIGPIYYYLTALFYKFTDLHPIASPLLAAVTSLFSFGVLYTLTRKIFSPFTGIWALFIYTFSSYIITSERPQWPVNFIPSFSLLILYFLYKVLTDHPKYIIYLAVFMGIFFHIHFTAVFYPIICICALPLLKWEKEYIRHYTVGLGVFLLFFIPQIIYYTQAVHTENIHNYSGYLQSYYHGFHIRRVMQLIFDAFIKFQSVLEVPYAQLKYSMFLYTPAFTALYLWEKRTKQKIILCYLITLWFLVPWLIFSTYKGELTDYYFNSTLYVAVVILAWLTNYIWAMRKIVINITILAFWGYYGYANTQHVLRTTHKTDYNAIFISALEQANVSNYYNFVHGDPKSYMYYYHMYKLKKELPYKL